MVEAKKFVIAIAVITVLTLLIDLQPAKVFTTASTLLAEGNFIALAIYCTTFVFTLIGIYVLALQKNWQWRRAFFIFYFSAVWVNWSFRLQSTAGYTYTDAILSVAEKGSFAKAMATYWPSLLTAFVITVVLFVCGHFFYRRIPKYLSKRSLFWLLPAFVTSFYSIHFSGGELQPYSSVFAIPAQLVSVQYSYPKKEKRLPAPEPLLPKRAKHIVLIVDESIHPGQLGLYKNEATTTPYLVKNKHTLQVLPPATAYTNYSAGSNISLISAARAEQLPDNEQKLLKQPGLFSYAKAAGYSTVLIDAQQQYMKGIEFPLLQNYFALADASLIDSVYFSPVERALADSVAAERIIQLLQSDTPSFIYLIKSGAHWPYQTSYPPYAARYLAEENSWLNSTADSALAMNSYYNAIHWSVDRFWKQLLEAELGDSFILYTSDHGQRLPAYAFARTHASLYKADPREGQVPLWFYDTEGIAPPVSQHNFHHENIPATLLMLMGYRKQQLAHLAASIFEQSDTTSRYFLSGDVWGKGTHKMNNSLLQQ